MKMWITRRLHSAARLIIPRWLYLAALGFGSLLLYGVGLLAPYSLSALNLRPLLDIAKLTRGQPLAQAGFVLVIALLFGVYYLAWRLCRRQHSRAMWTTLIVSIGAMNLSLRWLYPIGAADLFDNIMRGRITSVHGGDPFYDTPYSYQSDPFFHYTGWVYYTSAYGPGWELITAGTSRLAGDDVLANVFAFKTVGLLFYTGCVAMLALCLKRQSPERALQGVCLFAWNPLVLYETAGNGHNDIVMVFFVLLGVCLLSRGHFTLSAAALTLGALIKFIPALLVPIALVAGFRSIDTGRARIRFLIVTGLVCTALTYIAYAPFWRGGELGNMLGLTWRSRLFTTSIPSILQASLQSSVSTDASNAIANRLALVVAGAIVITQTWQVWRKPDGLQSIRAAACVLLMYLLFAGPWFQSWYVIWPLALAALLPEGTLTRTIALFSFTAFGKVIAFNDAYAAFRSTSSPVGLELIVTLATCGLVWLYLVYVQVRRSRRLNFSRQSLSARAQHL